MNYIKSGDVWIERLAGAKHRKDKVVVIKVEDNYVAYEYLGHHGESYNMHVHAFITEFRKFA